MTEAIGKSRSARLQELLQKNDVSYDRNLKVDPYSFLPGWLHPREEVLVIPALLYAHDAHRERVRHGFGACFYAELFENGGDMVSHRFR